KRLREITFPTTRTLITMIESPSSVRSMTPRSPSLGPCSSSGGLSCAIRCAPASLQWVMSRGGRAPWSQGSKGDVAGTTAAPAWSGGQVDQIGWSVREYTGLLLLHDERLAEADSL